MLNRKCAQLHLNAHHARIWWNVGKIVLQHEPQKWINQFFFFFLTRPGLWWFRVSLFRVFQPVPAPHPVPPLFFFLSKYSLWRRCCDIVGHQRSGFNENLLLHAVLAPYHIIHAYRCFMWALSSMRICKGCAPDRTLWGHFTYLKGAGP